MRLEKDRLYILTYIEPVQVYIACLIKSSLYFGQNSYSKIHTASLQIVFYFVFASYLSGNIFLVLYISSHMCVFFSGPCL